MTLTEERTATYQLAKVVGVTAIMASAVTNEYGVTINLASVQSVSLHPGVQDLVPLAMLLAGLVLLPKVLLYMRFSRVMPSAGSVYVWISRTTTLPIGFVVSFLNWVSLTAAIGVVAFAFGTFLGQALVAAGISSGAGLLTPLGHILLGLALIWGIFAIHSSGVHRYGTLVTIVFGIIVAVVVVTVLVGFTTPSSTFLAIAQHATGTTLVAPSHPLAVSVADVLAVTGLFVAAYGGLNAATSLGGEARNAKRTTPLGLFWGWAMAVILYTAVVAAVFNAVPWWSIIELNKSGHSAVATAPGLVTLIAPHVVGVVLALVVALVVGKTIAPIMLVCSRSLFAWGEDGLIAHQFGETSKRKVPQLALLVTAGLASLFLIQSTYIGWAIGLIIRSLVILFVMALVAVGVLLARYQRRFHDIEWAHEVSQGWWVPAVAVLTIAIAAVLITTVAVVPKTPVVFQPWFQAIVSACLGLVVFGWASLRAKQQGRVLQQVALTIPVE